MGGAGGSGEVRKVIIFMTRCKVKKYLSISVRDLAAIENTRSKFFNESSGAESKRYYVVAVAGDETYPYGVTYADSHLEAREAVREAHARFDLPAPVVTTVVGNCRQQRCTCNNAIFALRSERPTLKG